MRTRRFPLAFVALAALLLAVPATAQIGQGRLTGTVTDAQSAVLPGVTVTVKSPALIGTQTTVSEADGKYRFPALPSGVYTVVFELQGFQVLQREGIVVALGSTVNVDVQLQIASLSESVTVQGASPIVDMQSTKVGTDFTTDKLQGVPTATDIWAVLGQAAGVRMTGFDVGGSHKSQQSGYESFGIRNQNRVISEGIDTTEGSGGAGFYADYFANEEVAVSAAGGDVEMNTPGSAVISTVKSGGNTFKSLLNYTYEGGSFVGDNIDTTTAARGFTGQPNLVFWEGHADLGGPIMRDKAWFFAAYNQFKINKAISGVDRNVSTDLGLFHNFSAKGTVKTSEKNVFIGYMQWARKQKPNRNLSAAVSPDSVLAQDSTTWLYKGEYQRFWSNRLFTDVKVNYFGYNWPMVPKVDPKTDPPRFDSGTGYRTGAGWETYGAYTNGRDKPHVMAQATYYVPNKAGSHDLKFGYEWVLDIEHYGVNGNSGPFEYLDLNGQVDRIMITDVNTFDSFGTSWKGGNDRDLRNSLYAQDRWAPNSRLTLTLGLRLDRQRPYYLDGVRDPLVQDVLTASSGPLAGQKVFEPRTTPGATIFTRNTFAPRLGASYDLSGKGRTLLKGFWGRYYFNYADSFTGANPGGISTKTFKFLDLNGNRVYDGPQELGALLDSTGGTSTTADTQMKSPYADEIDLSIEHQFWGESSARVAYVRKMSRYNFGRINVAREGQFVVPVNIPVVIRNYGDPTSTVETFSLLDLPSKITPSNVITNYPDGDYNYDTLQFAFTKRFESGLFVQGSYDYQWRDELRNVSPSSSPLNSDPLGVGYFQNVNPAVSNRQTSTNWQGRVMGRYVFKYDVGVAANFRAQSGFAFARVISATLPNAGTSSFYAANIDTNQSDMVPILDLRVDKAFTVNRFKLTGMLDLFNVLNSNAVTNFFLTNGVNYNKIIATLDPRTVQLGVRFEF
jgi:hypothetical protein